MDFRTKSYDVFNMFNKQWAVAASGNIKDFNGCTIAWGSLGNVWGGDRSTVTVYINPLRYTFEYFMTNDYFTLSFFDETHKKDLAILGSKSGRDTDKFAMTSLTPERHEHGVTFREATLTFVCNKIYWQPFNPEHFIPDVSDLYARMKQPPHYEFIGEIAEVIDRR